MDKTGENLGKKNALLQMIALRHVWGLSSMVVLPPPTPSSYELPRGMREVIPPALAHFYPASQGKGKIYILRPKIDKIVLLRYKKVMFKTKKKDISFFIFQIYFFLCQKM